MGIYTYWSDQTTGPGIDFAYFGSAYNPQSAAHYVTGSEGGHMYVWNALQRIPVYGLNFQAAITAVAWSPDGRQIAGTRRSVDIVREKLAYDFLF